MNVVLAIVAVIWLALGYLTGRLLAAMDDDGPVPKSWPLKAWDFLTGFVFCWLVLAVVVAAILQIIEDRRAAGSAGQGDV